MCRISIYKLIIVLFVVFYHSHIFGHTIIIDPQYGGKEYGGCASTEKICAKDISLQIAKKLGAKLQLTYNVVYTRDTDQYLADDDRINFANSNNGDFFLRIGIAKSINVDKGGVEVRSIKRWNFKIGDTDEKKARSPQENKLIQKHFNFLKNKYEAGYRIAQIFYSELTKNFEMKEDNVKPDISIILDDVDMPAITVNIGYITNSKDATLMNNDSFQEKIAQVLYHALNKCNRDGELVFGGKALGIH